MPNFDPILTQKLLGTPFAGVGTTLERNSLQTLMKGLISENKYSVEYIINLCVSYGYSRQLAKEVFTELTGLSPELIVENNEYYQNPVFVPSGTIAWGLSKTNDKIAFYVVPFEYGYALNKKNETEVPEQIAQFVDINSAVKKMKGLVKKVFTIDQIITENLLLNEPIQSSAKNTHDTEEPYFSDPVRNLKNRYKKRYITDGEVKSEAFKLVASEEITEKEAVELAKWVDLEQEKRDLDDDEEDTALDDKNVEFGSVKNDPKGRLQEEAQENSRLKASADEETAKCFICEETYPISEMKQEEDVGWMCDHCIKAMKSQGYELKLKASKKLDDSKFEYTYITEEDWTDAKKHGQTLIDEGIKYMMFPIGSGDKSGKLCPVKIKSASKKATAEELTLFFNNNYNRPITKKEDIEKILEGTGVELEIAEDGQRSLKYNGKEYYLFNEDKLLKDGNELYIIKPAYLGNMKRKVTASIKRKADEFKLEDIKVEEQKSAIEKAEEEVNEANVEEFLNETTPQEYFDDEIQKDKIDNLNEKVSKIIDEFSARFDDFDKYDVSLQSYKIQMISDDKLSTTEVVEDLELNAKALIMIVLNINPKEDTTNVKKGLAIFSVNNDKTYWSGTFKTEDNKFYAFTEEGLDTLFRDLDTSMEITEDFVGNKKTNL